MTEIFRPPFFQPDSINGVPLAGALLYFYVAGTTTPITVYQDSGLITPHQSPVVADASGIFPAIYVNTTTYKIVLQTSAGVAVKTYDNINTTSSGATVLDSTFVIQNASDLTKQAQFSVASITTGTTRTFTLPDASGTLLTTGSTATLPQAKAASSSSVILAPNSLAQERGLGYQPVNYGVTCAVGSSALTIAIVGMDGTAISSTNPATFVYRDVTPATGTTTALTATAAIALVISSGSTLGAPTGSVPFKIWGGTFNDGGTIRAWAMLATTLASGIRTQYPLGAYGIASSAAEGGGGGADSAQTFYTGSAVTSKAYNTLFCLHYETGLVTAGTWAGVPTRIQLFDPSVPLPGRVVQVARSQDPAFASGTTVVPGDDTIPQITEGDQYMSKALTPSSAANILTVEHQGQYANSAAGGNFMAASIFQDSTANALATGWHEQIDTGGFEQIGVNYAMVSGTSVSTTFKVRAGYAGAGTTYFNGQGAARRYGGVSASWLEIEEIAA